MKRVAVVVLVVLVTLPGCQTSLVAAGQSYPAEYLLVAEPWARYPHHPWSTLTLLDDARFELMFATRLNPKGAARIYSGSWAADGDRKITISVDCRDHQEWPSCFRLVSPLPEPRGGK